MEGSPCVDNVLDSVERGRHAEASKLWCPKGHAYDSINAKGERCCKRCAGAQGWAGTTIMVSQGGNMDRNIDIELAQRLVDEASKDIMSPNVNHQRRASEKATVALALFARWA